jgi:hypothetical protein
MAGPFLCDHSLPVGRGDRSLHFSEAALDLGDASLHRLDEVVVVAGAVAEETVHSFDEPTHAVGQIGIGHVGFSLLGRPSLPAGHGAGLFDVSFGFRHASAVPTTCGKNFQRLETEGLSCSGRRQGDHVDNFDGLLSFADTLDQVTMIAAEGVF